MAIRIQCSHCGKKYKLPDNAAGGQAKCKECGKRIRVPKPEHSNTDNFLDALDAATAEQSADAGENPAPLSLPPAGRKKRKRKKAEASRSASNGPLQYAVIGAIAGAIIFAVFGVVDMFLSSPALSIVYRQPEDSFLITGIIYIVIGAAFGVMVMFMARLCDSMAAGLITGAVLMAAEKGIGMAMIPGVGSGLQAFGIIIGAVYGLFFSWRILVFANESITHE